jgi:hypothetical protein
MSKILKIKRILRLTIEIKGEKMIEGMPVIIEGKTFNIISKGVDQKGKDLFFGPITNDEFIILEDHWTMAHVLHACGLFKSVTQARKNGGDEEIPRGFSMVTRGKKANKCNIFVLNL